MKSLTSVFNRINVLRSQYNSVATYLCVGLDCLCVKDGVGTVGVTCECEACLMVKRATILNELAHALEEAVTDVDTIRKDLKRHAEKRYNRARLRNVVSTMEKMARILGLE